MENVNNTGHEKNTAKTAIIAATVVVTFLLMAFLVKQMVNITNPAPVGAVRAQERTKFNAEIRAAAATESGTYGYFAEPATARAQGVVRIPIEEAKKLTVQGYQNPGAFRSNILSRLEKANLKPVYE
jgi:hypothetical protein